MHSTEGRSRGPLLVVDDDADLREALRNTLEEEGYKTVEAADGGSALAYLKQAPPPPLILLDWNMAPMNAPAFMEELMRIPSLKEIPVLLLTADAHVEARSHRSPYAGFLCKPVDLDELFRTVARFCA